MHDSGSRSIAVRAAALVGFGLVAGSSLAETELARPAVANKSLRVLFDSAHGSLTGITDLTKQREILEVGRPIALWSIELGDGARLEPANAKLFDWNHEDGESGELRLRWSGFERVDAPDLNVVATVKLRDSEPVIVWKIRLEDLEGKVVRSVAYPRVGPIAPQEIETLALPRWIGEATRAARRLLNLTQGTAQRWAWDYPGEMSMQFVTFYGKDGAGLLLSTNDTRLARKQFAAFGDGTSSFALETVHFAAIEREPQERYEPTYDVLLEVIDGDWYTAAERYRRWARHQWWVTSSRVRREQTPDWVRDTALWIWNRGRSPGVVGPAIALQQRTTLPVSVFWHWWHGCAYDVGFPEYLPPREGAESFRAAVANAEKHGIHSIVYMNQRLWGMTTRSWTDRNAAAFAVKRPDGAIEPEVYNTFTKAPCASMCIATEFWRDTYAGLAESAVRDFGVAGIYMDQACTSLGCYDPSHGHPLGGGTYWIEGFKALQSDIRRRCQDTKAVALAGEGCGEGWLPYLDMMLSLQVSLERYAASGEWEPLPLFNAVYHDCATQYGNYSSLMRPPYDDLWPEEFAPKEPLALLDRKFGTQFRLEQARSFVWGQQPTLANFRENQFEERSAETEYVLRIARLRLAALKYLRDGVMLRPLDIVVPHAEIPMSRLSIYAGQQGAVQESSKRVPLVLASAWLAPDGDIGLALANISDKPASIHLDIAKGEHPIPNEGVVYRQSDHDRTEVARFEGGAARFEVTLSAGDVRVYEVVGIRK
jgi:hypothetical protein